VNTLRPPVLAAALGLAAVLGAAVCLAAAFACSAPANQTSSSRTIEIRVTNAGYEPTRLETTAGETVRLAFHSETDSECASTVQSEELGIPLTRLHKGRTTVVENQDAPAGEYSFACGMSMLRGTLVVKN